MKYIVLLSGLVLAGCSVSDQPAWVVSQSERFIEVCQVGGSAQVSVDKAGEHCAKYGLKARYQSRGPNFCALHLLEPDPFYTKMYHCVP